MISGVCSNLKQKKCRKYLLYHDDATIFAYMTDGIESIPSIHAHIFNSISTEFVHALLLFFSRLFKFARCLHSEQIYYNIWPTAVFSPSIFQRRLLSPSSPHTYIQQKRKRFFFKKKLRQYHIFIRDFVFLLFSPVVFDRRRTIFGRADLCSRTRSAFWNMIPQSTYARGHINFIYLFFLILSDAIAPYTPSKNADLFSYCLTLSHSPSVPALQQFTFALFYVIYSALFSHFCWDP